jgi:ribosomal protein S8
MMITTEKTLVEVLEVLRQRGYTEDFNLLEVRDSYKKDGEKINLKDIVIDKIYRFSGQNDVNDEAILYAMRNLKDGAKGVFVNGYGTYTDPEATDIIRQISVQEDDGDTWL